MLAMEEHDEDEGLCGSGRQSVTPYVYGRFVLYCCWESKSLDHTFSCPRFSLSILTSTVAFYSTRSLRLHCDPVPDMWPQGRWTPIP
jgi:hypothetical protein